MAPFTLRLDTIAVKRCRTLRLADGARARTQNHRFPRFRLTRAEDEQGNSLIFQQPAPFPFDFETSRSVIIFLKPPAQATKKVAHLEGVALVVVPLGRETLEIPDISAAKGVAHSVGRGENAVTLTVQEIERTDKSLFVRFKVLARTPQKQGAGLNPYLSAKFLAASLKLKNAEGRLLSAQSSTNNGNDGELTLGIKFTPEFFPRPGQDWNLWTDLPYPTGPLSLLLDAPSEFVQTQVPFSFSDLPLP